MSTDLFVNLPRGLRNNNPLNIVRSRSNWKGLSGYDENFCIFDSLTNGFRASILNLRSYLKRFPDYDLSSTIRRWCPDSSSSSYVSFVVRQTSLLPWTSLSTILSSFTLLSELLFSMCCVENGYDFCNSATWCLKLKNSINSAIDEVGLLKK